MANEIAPLAAVQEKIKDKIRAEFVGLIPDEMWSAMVQSVISEFTEDTKDRYQHTPIAAPIKKMIRDEIEGLAKTQLKQELDRLGAGAWNQFGAPSANDAIKKLIAEHLPTMLAALQAGMVEMAVMSAVNHMRHSMQRV